MGQQILRSPYTEQLDRCTEEQLCEIAHIKRFLECLNGDKEFREEIEAGDRSLADIARDRGCQLDDLESLRPIFDDDYAQFRNDATNETWPLTARWDQHHQATMSCLPFYLGLGDTDGIFPEFDDWRSKQIVRTILDVGPMANAIIHPPVSFELSDGCSVGCWFCGISAKTFGGHFPLESGGAEFWRGTVKAVQSVIGRGMNTGFLYWATEPLDHPDYLEFVKIYHEEVGVIPQTTTAIALRDVGRTREVLENWKSSRFFPNRFSVLTTQIMRRIHKEFTPEELLGVELVMQNSESLQPKQTAGKALDNGALSEKRKSEKMQAGTIACVTGFLVNMPKKTVRLASPTLATPEVPDGYYVYAESQFETPEELAEIMREMIVNEAKRAVNSNQAISIGSNYWFEQAGDTHRLRQNSLGFGMKLFSTIGPMLQSGKHTPNEIIKEAIRAGYDPILTIKVMSELTKTGLIGDILRPAQLQLDAEAARVPSVRLSPGDDVVQRKEAMN